MLVTKGLHHFCFLIETVFNSNYLKIINITAIEQPIQNPCQPSPCGPNSQCQVINDRPSCSCMSEFIGSPPYCKPECIINDECSNKLACINQKCKDPCVGSCGANAVCNVVTHTPMCTCAAGFTGDPFTQCTTQQRKPFIPISDVSRSTALNLLGPFYRDIPPKNGPN